MGCPGSNPQHHHGDQVNSIASQLFSDGDKDYLGLAVVGISASPQHGVWQYHRGSWNTTEDPLVDNLTSAIWLNMPLGLTETHSFLLHGRDRVRFLPIPDAYWNENEAPPPLLVKAWDVSLSQLTASPSPEISLMNANTLSYVDTLQSLARPEGLFSEEIAVLKVGRLGCDGDVNSGQVHDACCMCAGNGFTCSGCDGAASSNVVRDACDVCGGSSTACLGCDYIPFSVTEPGSCGECISYASVLFSNSVRELSFPSSFFVDCSGTCYGTALVDGCSICSGGNTSHLYNSDM